jgi:hypothetical protein
MKKETNNLSNEHLDKIKHRIAYKINESARYRQLVNTDEEFDQIPLTNEADEEEIPNKENTPEDQPKDTNSVGLDAPVPEFDKAGAETEEIPSNDQVPPVNEPQVNPEQEVDRIQNDIIKHNIEAMKSIHDQLEGLNNMVQGLNSKLDSLNTEVEEVREPSNVEKLMSKKDSSGPFLYNLNDYWGGNWYNEKHGNNEEEVEQGIKKLPDGTYVANFDDLPKMSKIDVNKSFNSLMESKESDLKQRILYFLNIIKRDYPNDNEMYIKYVNLIKTKGIDFAIKDFTKYNSQNPKVLNFLERVKRDHPNDSEIYDNYAYMVKEYGIDRTIKIYNQKD